ncbi:hypothetical protein MUP01_00265 [Candidatus Bathyarchaeota archaeon]|nr:hypothetical protein [Candidatus Bathyarchaeota archaeon]
MTTLFRLKGSGLAESTLKHVSWHLSFLARYCDLDNPTEVAGFLANMKGANSYKDTFVKSYSAYVQLNGLCWKKPTYRWERKIPKIPTTEALNKIISRASKKYAVIFRLLMETGVMPHELANVSLRDIDLERRVLCVQGFKGHASRTFKIKGETLARTSGFYSLALITRGISEESKRRN